MLSWSCDAASNLVQAEYILEEKAQGVRLGALWPNLSWRTKLGIVEQAVNFDHSLTTVRFKTHGCIYFKEDLRRLTGSLDSLEAVQFNADRPSLNVDEYAIGPLTKDELWANGREQMNLDRGPCRFIADCWEWHLALTRNRARPSAVYAEISQQRDGMGSKVC